MKTVMINTIKAKANRVIAASFMCLALVACDNDDDVSEPVNEEELITTVRVELTPMGGGTPIVLQSQDLDDDGPNAPVETVSGSLNANTTYTGTVQVLNESETPSENITLEVIEESDEHQFFFTAAGGLNVSTIYGDFDGDGNPLGTMITVATGDASTGSYTVTLRHEPTKPNTGLADAGGETDIASTFQVTIQ